MARQPSGLLMSLLRRPAQPFPRLRLIPGKTQAIQVHTAQLKLGRHITGNMSETNGYGLAQFTNRSKILGPLRTDPRTAEFFDDYYKERMAGL